MSYTRTFHHVWALNGAKTNTIVSAVSLVPDATSTTTYARLFHSALTVRLVSASVTVTSISSDAAKSAPATAAGFAAGKGSVKSTHELALTFGIAAGGSSRTYSLDNYPGLRRILRGVADAGEIPHLVVATSAAFDATSVEVAYIALSFTVEFSGESINNFFTPQLAALA